MISVGTLSGCSERSELEVVRTRFLGGESFTEHIKIKLN
jgi:hypothetical protein